MGIRRIPMTCLLTRANAAPRTLLGAGTIARRLVVASILICLPMSVPVALSTSVTDPQSDNMTVDVLKQAINVGNELGVSRALSAVRQRMSREKRVDPEMLGFLWDLWNGEAGKHPDLNWRVAERPVTRAEVASTLVYLSVRGGHETELAPFREYARESVGDANLYVAIHTLNILEMIDDPDDVPLVFATALEDSGTKFRAAVLTLASMCNDAASEALSELWDAVETEGERAFIDEQTKKFGGRSRRFRGCEPNPGQ